MVSFSTSLKLAVVALLANDALARRFTVKNNCRFTIWPAIFTGNPAHGTPSRSNGWEARPGSSVSFTVPESWTAGRIWGRTGCNFSGNSGPTSCHTGGCNGGLVCDARTGGGVPPVTLAEFTLGTNGADNYDVSLVDGFNLPMAITNSAGCFAPDCRADLNANCPARLQLRNGGRTIGCKSACIANLDGRPQDSANCCTGSHNQPGTCPPSGVQYYSYFKNACRNTYVYAYDESSHTALWTCPSGRKADYTITFCP